MHLFRARQIRALRESGVELSHMEARVLSFFAGNPGATLSALMSHSGRDKGQLARVISGLRQRGLLDAQPDEHDRRNLRVYLTTAGKDIADVLCIQKHQLSRLAVQGLSDDEERILASLLARVLKNLDDMSG